MPDSKIPHREVLHTEVSNGFPRYIFRTAEAGGILKEIQASEYLGDVDICLKDYICCPYTSTDEDAHLLRCLREVQQKRGRALHKDFLDLVEEPYPDKKNKTEKAKDEKHRKVVADKLKILGLNTVVDRVNNDYFLKILAEVPLLDRPSSELLALYERASKLGINRFMVDGQAKKTKARRYLETEKPGLDLFFAAVRYALDTADLKSEDLVRLKGLEAYVANCKYRQIQKEVNSIKSPFKVFLEKIAGGLGLAEKKALVSEWVRDNVVLAKDLKVVDANPEANLAVADDNIVVLDSVRKGRNLDEEPEGPIPLEPQEKVK